MGGIWGRHFAERNGPAWASVARATLEGKGASATEALKVADMDYGVEKQRLYLPPQIEGGDWEPTAQMAIVRPAWRGEPKAILGYVSDEYTPLQNGELCKMLDPLTVQYPVETIGALGKGEAVFVTLWVGSRKIGGDDVRVYLFAYNTHDGSTALKINVTPVRVVCQNTCIMGLQQAYITLDVSHTRRIYRDAQFGINLIAKLADAENKTLSSLDRLTKIHLTSEQINRVLATTYPEKPEPVKLNQLKMYQTGVVQELTDERVGELLGVQVDYEQARAHAIRLRLGAAERMQAFNDERGTYADTGWALWNGITETESWRKGGSPAQRAASILTGPRGQAMQRAFNAISELAV